MLVVAAFVSCVVISLGSLVFSAVYVMSHSDNIYVVDHGEAFSATAYDEDKQIYDECVDHVTRFHELFFNVWPDKTSIETNVERALGMCDRSGYNYYQDLSEQGFYSRLISANINQYVTVDSVKVNVAAYPFKEVTYARLHVMRESNITEYAIVTSGELVRVGRSKGNPHGLMLEKFVVVSNNKVETRRRR